MATGNMGAALGCLALTLVYLAGGWWLWVRTRIAHGEWAVAPTTRAQLKSRQVI